MSVGGSGLSTGFDVRRDPLDVPGARVDEFLEPVLEEELSEMLRRASETSTALLITAGRTRIRWANRSRDVGMGLSLCGLSGIDEFEPDEGVVHAAAGTPIREIQAAVAAEGWQLSLDPPGAASTLGGVLATAVEGPRAQRFGRVADAILGLEVVGADGQRARCGGRVVKNVTGYDLAKLHCGAFGSLGVISGAWMRLRPLPAVRIALETSSRPDREAFEKCRALSKRTSVSALVWTEGGELAEPRLEIELAGSDAEVEADRRLIDLQEIGERAAREVSSSLVDHRRDERAVAADAGSVALRMRCLGSGLFDLVEAVRSVGLSMSVDLGRGTLHARGCVDAGSVLVELRRRAEALGGLATFEAMPDAWRAELDVFGSSGGTQTLMAELKRRFDPQGILNPGRFMGGL